MTNLKPPKKVSKATSKAPTKARTSLTPEKSAPVKPTGKGKEQPKKSNSIPSQARIPRESSRSGESHEETATMAQVLQRLEEMEGKIKIVS